MLNERAKDRVNGWDRSREIIRSTLKTLPDRLTRCTAGSTHPVHVEVQAAWEALPGDVKSAPEVMAPSVVAQNPDVVAPERREALSDAFSTHLRTIAMDSMDDLRKRIFALSSQPGATAWLEVTPSRFRGTSLKEAFPWALALFLGDPLPLPADLLTATDPLCRGPLTASSAETIRAHDDAKETLADCLIEAGYVVHLEVVGMYNAAPGNAPGDTSGAGRRLDIFARHLATGARLSLDVRRCNNATLARIAASPGDILAGAKEAEAEKNRTYDSPGDCPERVTFYPVVIGTQNELGPTARRVVAKLAIQAAKRDCTNGAEPSKAQVDRRRHWIRARLGITNMAAQARIMLAFVAGTPEAAVASASRHRHTSVARLQRRRQQCCCEAPNPGCCVCSGAPSTRPVGAPLRA